MSRIVNLNGLDENKRSIIQCELKPTRVIAGAGTGKTLVLSRRFEVLVKEKRINPFQILVVTFSRKASTNMRNRILQYIPELKIEKNKLYISTVHKFAKSFLEEEYGYIIGPKNILFDNREKWLVRDLITQELMLPISATSQAWLIIRKLNWLCQKEDREFTEEDIVEVARKELRILDKQKVLTKFPIEYMKEIYKHYVRKKEEEKLFTCDDFLLKCNKELEKEEVASKWNERFKSILIDEFQDIDDIQFEILKKLTQKNKGIFCVGDPDQSIYGFRGSVPNIFTKFGEYYSKVHGEVQTYKLEVNYRSTPQILEVANTLINTGREDKELNKTLITDKGNGNKVEIFVTDDPKKEIEEVVTKIMELHNEGIELKEIAVLYRNNSFSKDIENKLLERKVPYENIRSSLSFANREEIKNVIAWLNIAFLKDKKILGQSIKRIVAKPARGIGPKKIHEIFKNGFEIGFEQIRSLSNKNTKIREFWTLIEEIRKIAKDESTSFKERTIKILELSGLFDYYKQRNEDYRLDSIKTFISKIDDESDNLQQVKRKIELLHSQGIEKDSLILSTIHGSKGLEFEYVFVIKFMEGKLPSAISIKYAFDEEDLKERIAEEKRLAYVAFTRAKTGLVLTCCGGEDSISRFSEDISHLLEKKTDLGGEIIEEEYDEEEEDEAFKTQEEESGFIEEDLLDDMSEEEE